MTLPSTGFECNELNWEPSSTWIGVRHSKHCLISRTINDYYIKTDKKTSSSGNEQANLKATALF